MEFIPTLISSTLILVYLVVQLLDISNIFLSICFGFLAIATPIISFFVLFRKLRLRKMQADLQEALQEIDRLQKEVQELRCKNIKATPPKNKALENECYIKEILNQNKNLLIRIDERTKNNNFDLQNCKTFLEQLYMEMIRNKYK